MALVYKDKEYIQEEWIQVCYIREHGQIKKALASRRAAFLTLNGFLFFLDLKNSYKNVLRDGYVAITLQRKDLYRNRKEQISQNDTLELHVCYAHGIMSGQSEVTLANDIKMIDGIRIRHRYLKRLYNFQFLYDG